VKEIRKCMHTVSVALISGRVANVAVTLAASPLRAQAINGVSPAFQFGIYFQFQFSKNQNQSQCNATVWRMMALD
jgi:hypothetical protein